MDADLINKLLPSAVLIGMRIAVMMSVAPFFGGEVMPSLSKAAFTVAFTAVMLPVYTPPTIPQTLGAWVQVASGELAIGLLMALGLHFVFEAARLAGQIMGFQLGYSLVNIIDPQTQVDTPVLSVFLYTLVTLIFLQLNVHHWMLRGLAHSYQVVAPGQVTITTATMTTLMQAAGGIFRAAVEIAAPVIAATLLVDVLLAFMAKASPQIPVLVMGMAVKSMVGFAVLWVVVGNWPGLFARYFDGALRLTSQLLRSVY